MVNFIILVRGGRKVQRYISEKFTQSVEAPLFVKGCKVLFLGGI
jgi:hypothetical protein